MKKHKKFYVTSSIAYTNSFPHLGFALEITQSDVLARYHRILGDDVFFLTGTDEHGQKVVKSAKKNEKNPKEFTDEISKKFKLIPRKEGERTYDFVRMLWDLYNGVKKNFEIKCSLGILIGNSEDNFKPHIMITSHSKNKKRWSQRWWKV